MSKTRSYKEISRKQANLLICAATRAAERLENDDTIRLARGRLEDCDGQMCSLGHLLKEAKLPLTDGWVKPIVEFLIPRKAGPELPTLFFIEELCEKVYVVNDESKGDRIMGALALRRFCERLGKELI